VQLRRITVPTLVMHGLHDPLVAPSGGLALAKAIPDSRVVGFSGMGHDLPRALWLEFVREIAALAAPGRTVWASRIASGISRKCLARQAAAGLPMLLYWLATRAAGIVPPRAIAPGLRIGAPIKHSFRHDRAFAIPGEDA
jgi:hypothetical protein